MGFKYSYNITDAAQVINSAAYDACDMRVDSYLFNRGRMVARTRKEESNKDIK